MKRILSLFLPEPIALRLAYILAVLLAATPAAACDHFVRAYNTDATVDFCLWETDGTDLMTSATITAGEVKVSQSEGAEANCNDGSGACVTDEGSCYSLSLDATELDTARVYVTIIDTAAKTFLDKCIVIDTFGNASAQFPTADVNVATISNDAITAAAIAADAIGASELAASAIGTSEFAAESEINAEVLDVLNVDTFTELTSCPAATASFKTMVQYLYMLGRNKLTQTATTGTLFRDDGSTGLCTYTDSDALGVTTRGEGS